MVVGVLMTPPVAFVAKVTVMSTAPVVGSVVTASDEDDVLGGPATKRTLILLPPAPAN